MTLSPTFVLSDGFVVDAEVTPPGKDAETGREWDAQPVVWVLVGREVLKMKTDPDAFGPLPMKGDLITCDVVIRQWEMNGRSGLSVKLGRRHDVGSSAKAA